MSNEMKYDV